MKSPWPRRGAGLYSYEQARSTLRTPILLWGGFGLGVLALLFGIGILLAGGTEKPIAVVFAVTAIAYGVIASSIGLSVLRRMRQPRG